MKTLFKVSQTYQTVTPESCEVGDFEDSGFEYQDYDMSLRDVLREIKDSGQEYIELINDKELRIYGFTYTIDYKTGEDKTTCLHIYGKPSHLKRLHALIGGN